MVKHSKKVSTILPEKVVTGYLVGNLRCPLLYGGIVSVAGATAMELLCSGDILPSDFMKAKLTESQTDRAIRTAGEAHKRFDSPCHLAPGGNISLDRRAYTRRQLQFHFAQSVIKQTVRFAGEPSAFFPEVRTPFKHPKLNAQRRVNMNHLFNNGEPRPAALALEGLWTTASAAVTDAAGMEISTNYREALQKAGSNADRIAAARNDSGAALGKHVAEQLYNALPAISDAAGLAVSSQAVETFIGVF